MKYFTRPNLLRGIILCVLGIVAILLEGIWLRELPEELAAKLTVTFLIIAVAAGLGYAAAADIEADTKQEKDKYLN